MASVCARIGGVIAPFLVYVVSLLLAYITRVQCESKKSHLGFSDIFPKRLGIFSPNSTRLLHVPIWAYDSVTG